MKIMYCRKDFSSMTSTTILDKIDGKFIPPPSAPPPPPPHLQIKDRKMARFGFCAASSLILGGGFIPFKIVAPSAAGITVLYLRTGERMGQRKGHDLLFLFGWDEMVTPKSDCHLNSKYMHMIGDLYLKVASERKQKTENIVGSM